MSNLQNLSYAHMGLQGLKGSCAPHRGFWSLGLLWLSMASFSRLSRRTCVCRGALGVNLGAGNSGKPPTFNGYLPPLPQPPCPWRQGTFPEQCRDTGGRTLFPATDLLGNDEHHLKKCEPFHPRCSNHRHSKMLNARFC